MAGTRFLPISITAVRLLIAVAVLLHERPPPLWSHWDGAVADLYILAWAAAGLGALLLNWPKSKRGLLLMLVLDSVLACCLLLRGAPIYGLLLLLFGGLLWRAAGGRTPINPVLLPYLIMWWAIWIAAPQLAAHWVKNQPNYYDYIGWSVVVTVLAAAIWSSMDREARLAALSGDVWIDPIFSTGQPFGFDFTRWTKKVADLYGGNTSICFIALLNKSKAVNLFINTDFALDSAVIAEDIINNIAPSHLAEPGPQANGSLSTQFTMGYYPFALVKYSTVRSRLFSLGSRKGILVIAHGGEVDAMLQREMGLIDRAFEDVVARATSALELRTQSLVEAREVARRDLHDGVLQTLAAIRMRLLTMLQSHSSSDSQLRADIRSTAEIVALEQARLRSLLQETMDEDLPINLVEVLDVAIRTIALQWKMKIEFRSEEEAIPMHRESANNIELLIREIAANARRHMKSLHLICLLAIRDSDLIITLKDILQEGNDGQISKDGSGPMSSASLKQRLAIVNGRAYSDGLSGGLCVAIPMSYEDR